MTEIGAQYLQDMLDGYVDYHTRSQTSIVFGDPYSRWPDYVGRIEWNATWRGMRSKIRLPNSTPPADYPRGNRKDIGKSELTPTAWKSFCKFYRQDYACLRYSPPADCI